jgi:hypothetical protein
MRNTLSIEEHLTYHFPIRQGSTYLVVFIPVY